MVEITEGKINDTIIMNLCSYIAVHREKGLFGGIVNEVWVCSGDTLVPFSVWR